VPLGWELSQGRVVPYLSPHVPVTVPRRDRHMHFGPEFPAAESCTHKADMAELPI